MSTCRESELDALLAGELSPEDAARVRAHADTCAACKHALAWQRAERGWMAQRARREPRRAALSFEALEARLAARAPTPVVRQPPREGEWRHWGKMLMAAAAAVAFVGLVLPRGGGSGPSVDEPWSREVLVTGGVEACEDAAAALEARVGACLIASPVLALRRD
ncbi:zf-HC2 domain-containing protein [Myxococcus sp. K38C18041901]|uniref:zf-HC2 domain-containing protein n=1 Tax=Myxococcus guangdongensis TaxID=2906760 RepID=UPI0020A71A49|nr:zf-HC2 domain-containing protein [Myxococcus guangdongensis]MCP3062593.1 zf-HC2 domain-containing protein [Myxococcus guangdongensis]